MTNQKDKGWSWRSKALAGAGGALAGLGAFVLAKPMIRKGLAAEIRALGKGGARAVDDLKPVPQAVRDQAKVIAQALKDKGLDPRTAKIGISGTFSTGKSSLRRALGDELGMAVNYADKSGRNMAGFELANHVAKRGARPGHIAEQTLLLNRADPDKAGFDAMIRIHKPAEEIFRNLSKREKGAYQWDVLNLKKLDRTINDAFHKTKGEAFSPVRGVEIKLRPEGGFQADRILNSELAAKGINPKGMSREAKLQSLAAGKKVYSGFHQYLHGKNLLAGLGSMAAGGGAGVGGAHLLEKRGYSPEGHRQLGEMVGKSMGLRTGDSKDLVTEGSVSGDYGLRFPLFPWTDEQHAFPTQSREKILRKIDKSRRRGAELVADGVAGGGVLGEASAVRGLLEIGDGAHTVADLGAHYEKPKEMGAEAPGIRGAMRALPDSYFGGFGSLVEHLRTGYELDDIDPKKSPADRRTMSRLKAYGKETMSDIEQNLRRRHGMAPAEAKRRTGEFLKNFRPSAPVKAMGRIGREAAYVGNQTLRVVGTRNKIKARLKDAVAPS